MSHPSHHPWFCHPNNWWRGPASCYTFPLRTLFSNTSNLCSCLMWETKFHRHTEGVVVCPRGQARNSNRKPTRGRGQRPVSLRSPFHFCLHSVSVYGMQFRVMIWRKNEQIEHNHQLTVLLICCSCHQKRFLVNPFGRDSTPFLVSSLPWYYIHTHTNYLKNYIREQICQFMFGSPATVCSMHCALFLVCRNLISL